MMHTRVNVNIPEELLKKSENLVKTGMFSNFSELVRQGLREQIRKYESNFLPMSDEEKRLMALLKKLEENGQFIGEEEAQKHGIKF